jgi:hypothetical protein
VAITTVFDGQPTSQLAWAVLEQLPIGMDAIRSGRKSPAA